MTRNESKSPAGTRDNGSISRAAGGFAPGGAVQPDETRADCKAVLSAFWAQCPPATLPPPFEDLEVGERLRELPADATDCLAKLVDEYGREAVRAAGLIDLDPGGDWRPAERLGSPGRWLLALLDADGRPDQILSNWDTAFELFKQALQEDALRAQAASGGFLFLCLNVADCALLQASGFAAVPAKLAGSIDRPRWERLERWALEALGPPRECCEREVAGAGAATTAEGAESADDSGAPVARGGTGDRPELAVDEAPGRGIVLLEWSLLRQVAAESDAARNVCRRLALLTEGRLDAPIGPWILSASDGGPVEEIAEAVLLRDVEKLAALIKENLYCLDMPDEEDPTSGWREPETIRRPLLSLEELFTASADELYPLAVRVAEPGQIQMIHDTVKFCCDCRARRRPPASGGCPFGKLARPVHAGEAIRLESQVIGGLLKHAPRQRRAGLVSLYAPGGGGPKPKVDPVGPPKPFSCFKGLLLSGPAHVQLDGPTMTFVLPNQLAAVAAGADYVGDGRVLLDPWTNEPLVWLESIAPRPPRHKVFADAHRAASRADALALAKPTPSGLSAQASRLADAATFAASIDPDRETPMFALSNLLSLCSLPTIMLPIGGRLDGATTVLVLARDTEVAFSDCLAIQELIGLPIVLSGRANRARWESERKSRLAHSATEEDGLVLLTELPGGEVQSRARARMPDLFLFQRPRLVAVAPHVLSHSPQPVAKGKTRTGSNPATHLLRQFDLVVPYSKCDAIMRAPIRMLPVPSISIPAFRYVIAQTWGLEVASPATFDWRPGSWQVIEWIRDRLRGIENSSVAPPAAEACRKIVRLAVAAARLIRCSSTTVCT